MVDRANAEAVRAQLERGVHDGLRAALLAVPARDRDAWLDIVLGLEELPADGPALPRDGVPYLPCGVDALLRVIDRAPVTAADVFVDIGAGVGRATTIVALLTGARAIGIEIQPPLAAAARVLAERVHVADRVTCLAGDAATTPIVGTVYFLYCPFSGARLERVLDQIAGPACVCLLDLPLPASCLWLGHDDPPPTSGLAIYRRR